MKDFSPTTMWMSCEGWWEQRGCGRQPMDDLRLAVGDGQIRGSGHDIIGPFVLAGSLENGASVVIEKTYLGRHLVLYLGSYDGEGTMSGEWRIGYDRGRWAIVIRGHESQSENEIAELLPATRNEPK